MRIITVEEHFEHRQVSARVAELAGPPPLPAEGLADFSTAFTSDADSIARLGGNRLTHMDQGGIDIQVVSHGKGSPSTLNHPEASAGGATPRLTAWVIGNAYTSNGLKRTDPRRNLIIQIGQPRRRRALGQQRREDQQCCRHIPSH
jgi:hypothetical protein